MSTEDNWHQCRVAQVFEHDFAGHPHSAAYSRWRTPDSPAHRSTTPGLYKLDLVLKDIISGNVGTINTRMQFPDILTKSFR